MLVESFLEYLKSERNYSSATIVSYATDLLQFEAFFESLKEDITWETVSSSVIREWEICLLDEGKMTSTSVNRKLSALRSFYRYLAKMGKVEANPTLKVVGPKNKKRLPVFVKEKSMDKLLELMKEDVGFLGMRNRLLIQMLYLTGMRRAEMLGLADESVDFVQKQIKVTGKRNKQRLIPFGEELEISMREYIKERETAFPYCGKFFVSKSGGPMTEADLSKVVRTSLARVTTQKKRSPHVLRHAFATAMLNGDADLLAIRKLLGHESLKTTEIYTHLSFEELKDVYKSAHPRS